MKDAEKESWRGWSSTKYAAFSKAISFVVFGLALAWALQGAWIVGQTWVFTSSSADLHWGQIIPEIDANQLRLADGPVGSGKVSITREGVSIKPDIVVNNIHIYTTQDGDKLTASNQDVTLQEPGILAAVSGENPWWSARVGRINSFKADLAGSFPLRSSSPCKILFVSNVGGKSVLADVASGMNVLSIRDLAKLSTLRLAYSIVFALFLAWLTYTIAVRFKDICSTVAAAGFSSVLLAVQLGFQYICVFPGVFKTDTVINFLYGGSFSTWYSSLYMVYAAITAPFNPLWIQVPVIVGYFVICVYFFRHLTDIKLGRMWILLFLFLQILSPSVFSMLFSQQRIFVAAVLLFSALIVVIVEISKSSRPSQLGYVLLMLASLMRMEYWAVFLAVIVIDMFSTSGRVTTSLPRVGRVLLAAAGVCLLVNIILPRIYAVDFSRIDAKYKLVSLLDLAKSYADPSDPSDDIGQVIESMSNLERFHSVTGETFFWKDVAPQGDHFASELYWKLRPVMLQEVISQPSLSVMRTGKRLVEILSQPAWQINSRYNEEATQATYGTHQLRADRFGLSPTYEWQKPFEIAITTFYYNLSLFPLNGMYLFFIITVVPLVTRDWRILLLNSTVIVIVVAAAYASPTVNWSYLIIVPIWGMLVLPLNALLKAAKPAAS